MNLFVYEHITGGGLAGSPLPSSLAREGAAMLRAVLADLAALAGARGVRVAATVDERLARSFPPELTKRVALTAVRTRAESLEDFDRLASGSDGCLIIAPETGDVLLELTLRAGDAGARVLGSSAPAIRTASDKLELADRLSAQGIPCVPAVPYRRGRRPPFPSPWVAKPRSGAGSTDSHLLSDLDDDLDLEDGILTPYVPGVAASVLAIVGESGIHPLVPGVQRLSEDGRFRYLGGVVPLPSDAAGSSRAHSVDARTRAIELARRAIGAVPGLAGFVGVDLILRRGRERARACDPVDLVVEINPRLTTSYVGLRALSRGNLAERWLDAMLGRPASPIEWHDREVRFSSSGEVHEGMPV